MARCRKRTGTAVTDINQCYSIAGYKELNTAAKAIFRQRCIELLRINQLWWVDLPQLVRYSQGTVMYWEISQRVMEQGTVLSYEDRMGNRRYYPNPLEKQRRDIHNDLCVIESHFGFTPWDRKKLGVKSETSHDPLQDWIKKNVDEQ